MFIVMIASECAPVAKVGGLGDVVFGLSRELEIRGNAVEIILPKYNCMRYDQIWGLQVTHHDLQVSWGNGVIHCTVWFGFVHGRKCFFIEPHSEDNFFNRGGYYGYPDEAVRWAFFSKAALEYLMVTEKRPAILHCHDWQTGLVPVLLAAMYSHSMSNQRICYTIHNFKHQGVTEIDILQIAGLGQSHYFRDYRRLGNDHNGNALNFMKGGIVYSHFITTVSPTYSIESRKEEQSYGLAHTLSIYQNKYGGVLNGVDYEVWNPENDPYISSHYNRDHLAKKYLNKETLRDRLWLSQEDKPLIAYIGRLDEQKGVALIRQALLYAIQNEAQFLLLGASASFEMNHYFWQLKNQYNDNINCHIEIGFNEELAHLIYAGADMIVVPSLYEPCGLTQMIALRYGVVPIVRAVGGLADTVFDRDFSTKEPEYRNGYVFYEAEEAALESAMSRAIALWREEPEGFRQLMRRGMNYDYSWNLPGSRYLNIYEYIMQK